MKQFETRAEMLLRVQDALLQEPLLHGDDAHRQWLTDEIKKVIKSIAEEVPDMTDH